MGSLANPRCAERLSDYKVPETIAVSAEPLPRNANGKVRKKKLREELLGSQKAVSSA